MESAPASGAVNRALAIYDDARNASTLQILHTLVFAARARRTAAGAAALPIPVSEFGLS